MKKSRPLEGIHVFEIASMIFGPLAGQYLGDMGADVIKLEPPESDLTRSIGPTRSPLMGRLLPHKQSQQAQHRSGSKEARRSGDPTAPDLQDRCFAALAAHARSQSTRARLHGADEDQSRPGVLPCEGLCDDGLYAGRPAYDDIIQAASGLADLQSVIVGQPRFMPTIIADKVSGVHAAYAIVPALMHRLRTGEGQQVDIAMFETMAAFNMMEHQWGHVFEPPQGSMGYPPVSTASRRPYKTRDGFLALLPYSDSNWHRFFELAGDPRSWMIHASRPSPRGRSTSERCGC